MLTRYKASDFYALHADEEARLDREAPALGMKARLRPYFPLAFSVETTLFTIADGTKIVAIAECFPHESIKDGLDLSYITVDKDYRDQRLASALVSDIVDFMQSHGYCKLDCSYYTDSGHAHLKRVLRRIGEQGVQLLESGKPYRGTASKISRHSAVRKVGKEDETNLREAACTQ